MKLINLKRSKKEAKAKDTAIEVGGDHEYYPWGFSINLNQETIPKFKALKNIDKIGGTVEIHAIGKINSISISEHEGSGKSQDMRIQIQKINIIRKGSDKDSFDEYAD